MTEEDEGEPPLPLRVSAASEPLPFDVPAVYSEPLPFDVSSVRVGLDEWLSLQLEASEALLASAKQEHAALLSSLAKPPTIEMEDLIGGRLLALLRKPVEEIKLFFKTQCSVLYFATLDELVKLHMGGRRPGPFLARSRFPGLFRGLFDFDEPKPCSSWRTCKQ